MHQKKRGLFTIASQANRHLCAFDLEAH